LLVLIVLPVLWPLLAVCTDQKKPRWHPPIEVLLGGDTAQNFLGVSVNKEKVIAQPTIARDIHR